MTLHNYTQMTLTERQNNKLWEKKGGLLMLFSCHIYFSYNSWFNKLFLSFIITNIAFVTVNVVNSAAGESITTVLLVLLQVPRIFFFFFFAAGC